MEKEHNLICAGRWNNVNSRINMMDNTLTAYFSSVYKALEANVNWRIGQVYFNILYIMRPDISERVRGTNLDPFYDDKIVNDFLEFVIGEW